MRAEQQRLSPAERANLVAYLDRELTEAEARVIETKLTQSPTARREVEVLQKTWEMLDALPLPRASERLTERTLTEIQQVSQQGRWFASRFRQTALKLARLGLVAAVAVLALAVGYLLTNRVWPNPSLRLARDLPIAEHLDEYREVDTFDFLQALADSPEFSPSRD